MDNGAEEREKLHPVVLVAVYVDRYEGGVPRSRLRSIEKGSGQNRIQ